MAKPRVKRSPCGRYWYDETAANGAAAFFPSHLRFTTGEWAGRPFVLAPWEEHDIIRPLFGWKRQDGTRRYRRCYVWVPRKNGKTELAAGVGILLLIADGEMGGQVFSIAADEDQAKIVFDKAVSMVGWSDALSKDLQCFKTSIFCPELTAAFKPLSGRPTGKHGLNMSGLVGDEIHEWPDGRLYTFVHQSSAARRQPLEFLISTAGERSGYGWEMWEYCQKILAGDVDDPEVLVVVYAADPEADWTDPETWAQANPNFPTSPKREYLESECLQAKELPRLENDFKRYHLNIWTEQAVRWLPIEAWDECGHPIAAELLPPAPQQVSGRKRGQRRPVNDRWLGIAEKMAGRTAYGGIDLSTTTDLSCLVWVFPPEQETGLWTVLPRFYVPQDRIMERVRRDKVEYDQWEKAGALVATPGNVVDYGFIREQVFADAERFKVRQIAIDRWNATQMTTELIGEGLDAVLFGQGFASMSAPSKFLERLVVSRQMDHGGHPLLRWCAKNVAVESDAAENIKPSKARSTERIDGIVGLVNALGVAIAAPKPEGPSIYDLPGVWDEDADQVPAPSASGPATRSTRSIYDT